MHPRGSALVVARGSLVHNAASRSVAHHVATVARVQLPTPVTARVPDTRAWIAQPQSVACRARTEALATHLTRAIAPSQGTAAQTVQFRSAPSPVCTMGHALRPMFAIASGPGIPASNVGTSCAGTVNFTLPKPAKMGT